MARIHTEIEIDAPASVVWDVLRDFESYSEWNPMLPTVEGRLARGSRLWITIRVPGLPRVRTPVRVHEVEEGRGFRWAGGPPFVFRGDHGFHVVPLGETRSRFIHDEVFRGLLSPVVGVDQDRAISGYEKLNLALKDRAERRYNAMHE